MNYNTIDDIYSANETIRNRFRDVVAALPAEKLNELPDGEKWSIAQIVEHVAMVNDGIIRICAKLLSKAEAADRPYSGEVVLSDAFVHSSVGMVDVKLEAPEVVQPVNGASVQESFSKMEATAAVADSLREKFEKFDGTEPKFPHPYFGDLSALEWLVLFGAHEARHLRQIRNRIA